MWRHKLWEEPFLPTKTCVWEPLLRRLLLVVTAAQEISPIYGIRVQTRLLGL